LSLYINEHLPHLTDIDLAFARAEVETMRIDHETLWKEIQTAIFLLITYLLQILIFQFKVFISLKSVHNIRIKILIQKVHHT